MVGPHDVFYFPANAGSSTWILFFTREYQHINQILFSVRVTSKFIWRMAEIRIFQFSFSPIIWNTIERKGTWKRWLLSKSMEKGITLHLFVISAVGIQYTRFFRLFVVNEEKFDFMKVDRQYTKRCQWTLFFPFNDILMNSP